MTARDLDPYVGRLLDDARNPSVSAHTRYSAACRALASNCDAERGSSADGVTVARWDERCYGDALVHPPTRADITVIPARVLAILRGTNRPLQDARAGPIYAER